MVYPPLRPSIFDSLFSVIHHILDSISKIATFSLDIFYVLLYISRFFNTSHWSEFSQFHLVATSPLPQNFFVLLLGIRVNKTQKCLNGTVVEENSLSHFLANSCQEVVFHKKYDYKLCSALFSLIVALVFLGFPCCSTNILCLSHI